jgi:general stress protein YciG
MKKLRPLEDDRRKRQRRTYLKNNGRKGYKEAGRLGGLKTSGKFNSETARLASLKSWENRRARQAESKEGE